MLHLSPARSGQNHECEFRNVLNSTVNRPGLRANPYTSRPSRYTTRSIIVSGMCCLVMQSQLSIQLLVPAYRHSGTVHSNPPGRQFFMENNFFALFCQATPTDKLPFTSCFFTRHVSRPDCESAKRNGQCVATDDNDIHYISQNVVIFPSRITTLLAKKQSKVENQAVRKCDHFFRDYVGAILPGDIRTIMVGGLES